MTVATHHRPPFRLNSNHFVFILFPILNRTSSYQLGAFGGFLASYLIPRMHAHVRTRRHMTWDHDKIEFRYCLLKMSSIVCSLTRDNLGRNHRISGDHCTVCHKHVMQHKIGEQCQSCGNYYTSLHQHTVECNGTLCRMIYSWYKYLFPSPPTNQ